MLTEWSGTARSSTSLFDFVPKVLKSDPIRS